MSKEKTGTNLLKQTRGDITVMPTSRGHVSHISNESSVESLVVQLTPLEVSYEDFLCLLSNKASFT